MKLKDILLIISSSVILTSCNYLDVVPSEIPQLSDAFKNEATAQNYIMGNVYGYIPTESSIAENPALLSTDELDIPWRNDKTNFKAYHINLGTLDTSSPYFNLWEGANGSKALYKGIREAYVVATENDACNGVAMLFGHLLTNRAQIFSDVRTYWSPEAVKRVTGKELTGLAANGIIHLINSGATTLDGTGQQTNAQGEPAMKPHWEISEVEMEKCLEATTWYPANRDYFRGGGFSSNFLSKGGMPVTMSRLNLVKGLGPVLQIAEGWTVEIDPEVHKLLDERTDRTWPTTWFVPRLCDKPAFEDVYSVMNNWGANHGAISYGHIGQDLITLASMLRIPVCMHNVDEKKIFRPAAWNAFGMDKEGADYRACTTYGPIYK